MSPHQAHLADDSLARDISDEEWKAAGAIDTGLTWLEFTDEQLLECREGLAHFDEESFVYYLPAFLSFAVRHCQEEGPQIARALVGSALFFITDLNPYNLARYKRLSPAQRDAVVCFLEFMSQHALYPRPSHAKEALMRYWKTDEAAKPLVIVP